ncbi:MAG: sigma-70 family RNA polymerase sigma factor [bacterium]
MVKRHYKLVSNLCLRFLLDAELARDAAQEIFLHVYEWLERIQKKDRPFKHWLCRVASNHCRNIYKRRKKEREIIQSGDSNLWSAASPFLMQDVEAENAEAVEMVNNALARIKLEERIPLVLLEMAGMTMQEIAKATRSPMFTVRRRIRRAKEKIKKILLQESLTEDAIAKK